MTVTKLKTGTLGSHVWAVASVLHNNMNCDEEEEDLYRLRWFGGIEKSANMDSLWFFFSHVLFIEASVAYLQLGAYYQSPI